MALILTNEKEGSIVNRKFHGNARSLSPAALALFGVPETRPTRLRRTSATATIAFVLPASVLTLLIWLLLVAPAGATEFHCEPGDGSFGVCNFDVTFTGPPPPGSTPTAPGSILSQAGSHPFEMTTSFEITGRQTSEGGIVLDQAFKDLLVSLMPGFAGSPTAVPTCSAADFLDRTSSVDGLFISNCPDSTAVGVIANILANRITVPTPAYSAVYNLAPSPGSVSKLGFWTGSIPVTIEVGLTEEPPYRVLAGPTNIPQLVSVLGSELTLWGVPADPRHDPFRGRCLEGTGESAGDCPAGVTGTPFLTMPRACRGPLATSYSADSWVHPGTYLADGLPDLSDPSWASGQSLTHDDAGNPQGMSGCGALPFGPEVSAAPTSKAANSPTGLAFSLDVNDEGLTNPAEEALASSDIERAEVTLPEGMTVNPSQAEGLAVCTEADLARESAFSEFGAGCPAASKIGSIEVETPLLEGKLLKGSLFVAAPYENPFGSLIAFYIVIEDRELGIKIVQPTKVTPNPVTGQLLATTEEMPELPFSHFRLHFKEGTRSPLVTPAACGSYAASARLYPTSGNPPVTSSSMFEIIAGPESGPCPSGGTPPFHPGLTAGTINNAAGSYSPFDIRLSRTDSEQEITHFSIKLPPGVTGRLAGIPFCPEAGIAAARSRERTPHGGQEEIDHPSCPAASEIGHTLVGAGVGPSLTYVPGKVYLAGPYNGSNLSIVAITAAKAGPFDLGTVVIREALKVDPETAEVSVDAGTSDPIPHIVEGIPVDLRDIRVYVDRPEFVKNPTNCTPTSTASTVLGSGTDFASEADDRPVTASSRFQAADCANLGFKPSLKISLKGPTKRAGLPALTAVVTPRAGDANIGRAVVTLPKSEFLEQGHIGNSCTRVQFNSGAGNGAGCPANSVLGHAVAVTPLLEEPLEGPVFLRSNGGERKLPDLVAALHSKDIDIVLVGFISSLHKKGSDVSQIRTTFAAVPDQPVTRFTLRMFGGKKGLLVNSQNLCKGTHKAISEFTGQNGKRYDTEPAVKAQCGKKKHKKAKKGHHKKKAGGKGRARLAAVLDHRLAW